jgi:sulfonate transport system substrate-binding protein
MANVNGARKKMSRSRRSILAGLSAALLLANVAASPVMAQELKEVRIGFQKAGIFPAVKARGTLEKVLKSRGIQVKWVEFQFGPPILEAINAGNVDFGYTGDAPPIFAQAARANLLYVAALPSAGANEAIIVPENSPIRTLADLKGKKIGFAKGSSAHNTTVAALEKAGIAYSEITPVTLGPADAVAAFAGGNLDAWTIWDPYLALAEKGKVRVIASAKDVHDANSFFLANRDFTGKHADIVALLNQTFAEESKWADEHRVEIAASLHEVTGVDSEALTRAVNRSTFLVTPITERVVASQQATADRFFRLGLIPKAIDVKEIVWKWTPGS